MKKLFAFACSVVFALMVMNSGTGKTPAKMTVAEWGKGKAPIGKGKAPPPVVAKG
jgi:hypothetical protein